MEKIKSTDLGNNPTTLVLDPQKNLQGLNLYFQKWDKSPLMKLLEENTSQGNTMDGRKPNRSPSVRQILQNLDNDPEIKAKTSRYKPTG